MTITQERGYSIPAARTRTDPPRVEWVPDQLGEDRRVTAKRKPGKVWYKYARRGHRNGDK